MAIKIDPNAKNIIKKDLKKLNIPSLYSGKIMPKGEGSVEHIPAASTQPPKYPVSKEELASRLKKIEKLIQQHPDDINLRKYYDALKHLIG